MVGEVTVQAADMCNQHLSSHGEEQEATEGAVVVAVVPDLSVVPQLQGECVSLLQQQGSAV